MWTFWAHLSGVKTSVWVLTEALETAVWTPRQADLQSNVSPFSTDEFSTSSIARILAAIWTMTPVFPVTDCLSCLRSLALKCLASSFQPKLLHSKNYYVRT